MKNSLVLLALVAAPSLVSAQTPTQPVRVAASQETMPNAQELFDNLFAPYAAARTFSGNIDIKFEGDNPENALDAISNFRLQTRYRFNEKGDLLGQDATLQIIGKGDDAEKQTLRLFDDGRTAYVVFVDQKAWSKVDQRDAIPALTSLLKPILDAVIQAVDKTPEAVLIVSEGIEAGRPVWIVTAQNSDALRVVVDTETRALRSLDVNGQDQKISIRGSQQAFNETLADTEFVWKAPAGFKKVPLGKIALPPSLTITIPGVASQQK